MRGFHGNSTVGLRTLIAGVLLVACGGCTSSVYERWADDSVYRLLTRRTERVLGDREDTVQYPEFVPPDDAAPSNPYTQASQDEVDLLSLADCLEIGIETSRDYLAQKDALYLTTLSLTGARHTFSPRMAATLSHVLNDAKGTEDSQQSTADASVRKILPSGGTLALRAGTTADFFNDETLLDDGLLDTSHERTANSSISVDFVQPLLRGGGYEATHEILTQAERNLIYAVRDFELFRQDFAIDVATRFYDLVQQQQAIENTRNNMISNRDLRRQAEALFKVGRSPELDVVRARRNELRAQDQLIASIESYKQALDRFKIFLGLSIEAPVDIEFQPPDFVPFDYDLTSSIDVALANRLDYLTQKQQVEDARRQVRIARNGLLPDLNFNLTYNLASNPEERFFRQEFDEEAYTVGLSLDLPFDRVFERNAYRSAQIASARAQRDFDLFNDNLILGIRAAFRELTRRRQSLTIQEELITSEQKNVKIAQIRFRQGEIPNRDVVEAQTSLLDARNGYINETVNYEIARLQLLRDLGILFIDERTGFFKE